MKNQLGKAFWVAAFVGISVSLELLAAAPLDAWTPRLSNTTNVLSSVAFGNGTFVAVGAAGTIFTSPDGVARERRTAPMTGDILRVRFLNGSFVALGQPFLI